MVLELRSVEDIEELLKRSRLVLLLVYDSGSPDGRYLSALLDDIAYTLEPVFAVAKLDAAEAPDVAARYARSMPRLMLFYKGKKVWEQIGFFYSSSSDRYAIRRGILYALMRLGLSPSSLGVRLSF